MLAMARVICSHHAKFRKLLGLASNNPPLFSRVVNGFVHSHPQCSNDTNLIYKVKVETPPTCWMLAPVPMAAIRWTGTNVTGGTLDFVPTRWIRSMTIKILLKVEQ